jgi:phosphoglucosamine mutase
LQPHFGIAIDGDGEICTVSDELGRPIDSADLLPVLARLLIAAELLLEAETAATIVLEEGTPARAVDVIEAAIMAAGGRLVLSKPTRQAMDTAMRDHDAVLGGGSSGRFWFRGPTPTADALVLLTHLLRILSQSDRPMSEVMRNE